MGKCKNLEILKFGFHSIYINVLVLFLCLQVYTKLRHTLLQNPIFIWLDFRTNIEEQLFGWETEDYQIRSFSYQRIMNSCVQKQSLKSQLLIICWQISKAISQMNWIACYFSHEYKIVMLNFFFFFFFTIFQRISDFLAIVQETNQYKFFSLFLCNL